jgi:hypothetical protein
MTDSDGFHLPILRSYKQQMVFEKGMNKSCRDTVNFTLPLISQRFLPLKVRGSFQRKKKECCSFLRQDVQEKLEPSENF